MLGYNQKHFFFKKYYAKKHGKKNNIDKIHEGVHGTVKFLTQNIIMSVIFFLVMTITGTLVIEAKTLFFDFYITIRVKPSFAFDPYFECPPHLLQICSKMRPISPKTMHTSTICPLGQKMHFLRHLSTLFA